MKIFLIILILIFNIQSLTKADDIRNFEIEEMSVGDSLLDYFSLDEIKKKINSYEDKGYIYNSRDFYSLTFKFLTKFEKYDAVQVQLKDNDKRYIIQTIDGLIYYKDDINQCYEKFESVEKEFDLLFKNSNKQKQKKSKHSYDKSGKSTTIAIFYNMTNRDYASIHCYDWFEDLNIDDSLTISLTTNEFNNFLINKAY